MNHSITALLLCTSGLMVACRPDPGDHRYAEDWSDPSALFEFTPGPDPYQQGQPRLSLGIFYESEESEEIPIDGQSANFFIYADEWSQKPTLSIQADILSRAEGYASDKFVHAGLGWWGCGIHLSQPRSLQAWTQLHVSFQSDQASFQEIQLHLKAGNIEAVVQASTYGYTNDGQWHWVNIPLQDFSDQGLDLGNVEIPFMLIGQGGTQGETLRVDNLYLTQD